MHPKPGFFTPKKFTPPSLEECRHCPHRNSCPYFYTQLGHHALCSAICQGQASAERLMAGAKQLRDTISSMETMGCLLNASEAVEHTLSHVLRSEMRSLEALTDPQPQMDPN